MAVMYQQRQVGRLAQIGDSTSFFDWSSSVLGFHEVDHSAIVGGLLSRLGLRDLSGRDAIGSVDRDSRL